MLGAKQLAALEPVPASEPWPRDLLEQIRAERAGGDRFARAGQAVTRAEPGLELPEVARAAYRPPWTDLLYVPRLVPHRPRRGRKQAAPVGPLPGLATLLLAPPAMHVLTAELAPSCAYPWQTAGAVFSGNMPNFDNVRNRGTGVLVGPNLVLTASHLFPWDHGPEGWWMRFVPGYVEGLEPYGRSFVQEVLGYPAREDPNGLDYVICRLYTPLGQRVGWMGSQSFGDEDDYYDGRWISIGYPDVFHGGQQAAAEFNIDIDDIDNDDNGSCELETNYTDAFGGGWSGGPLWGWIGNEPKVIGVKSGWEVDGYDPARGVFAAGTPMVDLVKHGWAHWQ